MTEPTAPLPPSMTAAPFSLAQPAPGELCANCDAPMQGPFCHACGQPKKGLIRHLSGIAADFLDSVLNFDSRTFRTVFPLYFKPGYLSNEYFAGRRVRYVTPLRLYIFLSVVLFLVISMITSVGNGPIETEGTPLTAKERAEKLAEVERGLQFIPEKDRAEVRREVAAEMERDQKRLAKEMELGPPAPPRASKGTDADADEDENDINVTFANGRRWHKTDNPLTFGWLSDDLNRALNEEIEVVVTKAKGVRKNPKPFVEEVFSIAPQALLLILPIFALLLKVMYLFKRRLYMEHLIVALHSHSFLCLSILVLIGLSQLQDKVPTLSGVCGFLAAVAGIWMPVYLYVMQKKVYRQGYILTTLKYIVIGTLYLFLLTFGLFATMIAGLIVL